MIHFPFAVSTSLFCPFLSFPCRFTVGCFTLLYCLLFCSAGVIASTVQKWEILRLYALCKYIEMWLFTAALSLGPGQTALKVYGSYKYC